MLLKMVEHCIFMYSELENVFITIGFLGLATSVVIRIEQWWNTVLSFIIIKYKIS